MSKTQAKAIGRIPMLTAAAAFLLESAAGTLLNKNLYLIIAFGALAISLLVQSFVKKEKMAKDAGVD